MPSVGRQTSRSGSLADEEMNTQITPLFFWLALALPVLIYSASALARRRKARADDQFFLAKDSLTRFEFSNSAIAYGFQIALVGVFLAWGYNRESLHLRSGWHTSKSAHGPWRLSQTPALALALPARYFSNLGLPSLAAR